MSYDSVREKTLLFGGHGGAGPGYLSDTWQWDGKTWTKLAWAPGAPGRRASHAMVFDESRGKMVLFGGTDNAGVYFGDTFEWDGASWAQVATDSAPTKRASAGMVYDATRRVTVLYGGMTDNNGRLSDMWEWDGRTWTERKPLKSPGFLRSMAAAYDANRGRTLLFGGSTGGSPSTSSKTWEFEAMNWLERVPVQRPDGRASSFMVFDAARHQTVLFGGLDSSNTHLDDTWEFDGGNWRLKATSESPSPRRAHALAYDAARGEVVLFGGVSGTAYQGDTWVYRLQACPPH